LGVQITFSFMRVYLLAEAGEKSLADMRRDVYTKLISMPMSFFSEKRVGELSNRISSDLSNIQDAISYTLAEFLRGIFTLTIGLIFIFWISTKLALIMLSVVPIIAILAVLFGKRIRKMSKRAQDQLAESGTIVQETFQGISVVKSFTSEFHEVGRYVKSISAVVETAISNARYRGAFISFMIFSVFGAIAFVMWVGANMIQSGEMTIGSLTMFVIFSMFVGGTFAGFADIFSQLQKTLGATQSVREILRGEGESISLESVMVEPAFRLNGQVRFENVAFNYPGRPDVAVLKGISLEAAPGQQIALVEEYDCSFIAAVLHAQQRHHCFRQPAIQRLPIDAIKGTDRLCSTGCTVVWRHHPRKHCLWQARGHRCRNTGCGRKGQCT
jgi:ABC-type multidrug transport system fused ATPase/permease subunit